MTPADPNPQRMLRAKLVFEQALELPPTDREAFVRSSIPDDGGLRDEVLAMLGHADAPSANLAMGAVAAAAAADAEDPHEQPTMLDLGGNHHTPGVTTVTVKQVMPDGRELLRDDERLRDVPKVDGYPVLDPYVLTEFVGAGGFGRVYRGCHLVLGTTVAVKCLGREVLKYAEAYPRFEREARLGAQLKSRHLVQVLDCNLRSGLLYMVMEWVEGEDLERRVKRLGPRPWQEVVVLLAGLAAGLAEVHENRVVHRDVKPANVLLDEQGVVKLADLGLARHTLDTKMQMSGRGIGTPAFMAPEQWDSAHECDARADVFSFGATACYLLTGKPPSLKRGVDLATQLDRQCTLPAELRDCIVDCLLEERGDRPSDGRALEIAMHQILARFELPESLSAAQVKHDRGRRAAPLDDATRTELRRAWQDQQAASATPTPVVGGGAAGAPPPGGTVPMPAPQPRPMLGIAVGAIAVLALGLSIWLLLRSPGATPGDGGTKTLGANEGTVTNDGQQPPQDGNGPKPSPSSDPAEKEQAKPAPPPPALALAGLRVGDRIVDLPAAGDDARIELPAVRLGTRARVTVGVTTNRAPLPDETVRIEGKGVQEEVVRDRTTTVEAIYSDGEQRLTITLPGANEPTARLLLVAPCDPPRRPPLELRPADERTDIHYELALAGAEPLRFVPVGDLLVGVTEVSNGQFRAFANSGRFAGLMADDPRFAEYLASRPMNIEKRVGNWQRNLEREDPDLPFSDGQIGEMVGFARWASEQAGAYEVRLPNTVEWRTVVNRSAGRADDDDGDGLPFPAGADLAGAANCAQDVQQSDPGDTPKTTIAIEPVWLRPQGRFGLRHLVGNVREITVDRYGDAPWLPLEGTLRGGHYSAPLDAARIPDLAERDRWSQPSQFTRPNKEVGFRLVIRP